MRSSLMLLGEELRVTGCVVVVRCVVVVQATVVPRTITQMTTRQRQRAVDPVVRRSAIEW
ncbi:hypothetical protein [Caballeronia sp. KNU42]